MPKSHSRDFKNILEGEAETLFNSELWKEIVSELFDLRLHASRSIEIIPLGEHAQIYQAAKCQGEIDGYEKLIRRIMAILEAEELPGLEKFPGL
jgi:hypothetical protein